MGKPTFGRGYKEVREKTEKSAKYMRSCFNCESYYETRSDEGEICQNPNVLEYDMIVEKNNVYCTQWKLCSQKNTETFGKKIGRARLD